MKKGDSKNEILDAISDLTMAVGKGFDRVDKRFDKNDKRFDDLQQQINRLETYILDDHQRRLELLESKVK